MLEQSAAAYVCPVPLLVAQPSKQPLAPVPPKATVVYELTLESFDKVTGPSIILNGQCF